LPAPVPQERVAGRERPSAPEIPSPVVAEASMAPPPPEPAAMPTAVPQEPAYLPRGELTVPPRPLDAIDVPFPEDVVGLVDLKVRVTLFIGEDGQVRRVRIDTPNVAEPFERAIRASFSAARFSPGELHEVPVRSQLRIEVAFAAPNAGTRPRRS
jgi:TonB family protein